MRTLGIYPDANKVSGIYLPLGEIRFEIAQQCSTLVVVVKASISGFYDYDFDLRIGTPILNFTDIFFA